MSILLEMLGLRKQKVKEGVEQKVESSVSMSKADIMNFINRYRGRIGFGAGSWFGIRDSDREVVRLLEQKGLVNIDGSGCNFRINQSIWECRQCIHWKGRSDPYSYNRCDVHGNLSQIIRIGHGRTCPDCMNSTLSSVLEGLN